MIGTRMRGLRMDAKTRTMRGEEEVMLNDPKRVDRKAARDRECALLPSMSIRAKDIWRLEAYID